MRWSCPSLPPNLSDLSKGGKERGRETLATVVSKPGRLRPAREKTCLARARPTERPARWPLPAACDPLACCCRLFPSETPRFRSAARGLVPPWPLSARFLGRDLVPFARPCWLCLGDPARPTQTKSNALAPLSVTCARSGAAPVVGRACWCQRVRRALAQQSRPTAVADPAPTCPAGSAPPPSLRALFLRQPRSLLRNPAASPQRAAPRRPSSSS